MPPRILQRFLAGDRARALWIEFDDYAHRVFANGAADWLTQSARYASAMAQARKAVRSEVVTMDISAAGLAVAGGEPLARCFAALADASAVRFTADCLAALVHTLGADVDLVLRVPAPQELLWRCGAVGAADFDTLDQVASAIVEAMRRYADLPLAGLLLTRASDDALGADEADAHEPILNAARHYGWVTAMAVPTSFVAANPAGVANVDLMLCGELSLARVREARTRGLRLGGGLVPEVWTEPGGMPPIQDGDLVFGVLPATAKPEIVLANCAALAAG